MSEGMWRRLLREFFRTRLAGAGLCILGVAVLCALFADYIAPHDPAFQDYEALAQPPSLNHPFGTDDIGRDVLARIIFGSRVSLQVGVIAVGIALSLGVPVGVVAGFAGGRLDNVFMRVVDAVKAFPALILALAITAVLGPAIGNVMVAVGIVSMPSIARLARGQTLSVREYEFITAARAVGATPARIMQRHIWPNITPPIIVQATLMIAGAVTTEASLSFLGLGVQPPTPSWGEMLRTGSKFLETAPWLALAPGAAIFLTVLAFNFVGDGLRRALDPRLMGGRHA